MDDKDFIIKKLQNDLIIQEKESRVLAAALLTALNMTNNKEIILGTNEVDTILEFNLPEFVQINENFMLVHSIEVKR